MYVDGYKKRCYPVLVGLIVDYEEQVLITGIKANMQCSICQCSIKKKKISNPVVGAVDPSVNLNTAYITKQQPSNLVEQNCRWLVASIRVLCMGPQAC